MRNRIRREDAEKLELNKLKLFRETMLASGEKLGLEISEQQLSAHCLHFELLLSHRDRAGLTSLKDPREIAIKHFLDSLACLLLRDIKTSECVADVGSGAGFPGLVLAAARPLASYTLIEANRKRAAFLREAASTLAFPQVIVLPERAEEIGHRKEHREVYDLVLSRAVAPLPTLLEYCLPLVKPGAQFLAQKGPDAPQEIKESAQALEALGGRVARLHSLSLPLTMGERMLVLVEKTEPTPERYPRRPGRPSKSPL